MSASLSRRAAAVAAALSLVLAAGSASAASASAGTGAPAVDDTVVSDTFEDGTSAGWVRATNTESLSVTDTAARTGERSLLVADRTFNYTGASRVLTDVVQPGQRYQVSAWLRLVPGTPDAPLQATAITNGSTFTYLNQTVASADRWTQLTATATTPDAALNTFVIKLEGTADVDFLVDDVSVVRIPPPPPVQDDIPGLKDVYADEFDVGAAIFSSAVDNPRVSEVLTRHFSSLTAEAEMKWSFLQPQEGVWDWEGADRIVDFALANDMQVRGHTLIWHQSMPAWAFLHPETGEPLQATPEDQQILLDRMETHITTVMQRYEDDVLVWDVVNEVIDTNSTNPDLWRTSRWYEVLGTDYIAAAFEFAHAAVPEATLYYNDYETEFAFKAEPVYDMLEDLLEDGVPVHGIGHQMHLTMFNPSAAEVRDSIELFATLPIVQDVTELDVGVTSRDTSFETISDEVLVEQAHYYKDLFQIFSDNADVIDSVTTWGVHDGATWLLTWPQARAEAPLLFDPLQQAKLAYWGVVDPSVLPPRPYFQEYDQCRRGGWQYFVTDYRSQGDCLSTKVREVRNRP